MRQRTIVLLILAAAVLGHPQLRADDASPAEKRLREVADRIAADPGDPSDLFARPFLQQVPKEKLVALLKELHRSGGKVASIERLAGGKLDGRFVLVQEKESRLEATIAVEAKEPHRIVMLFFKPAAPAAKDYDALARELRRLPGVASFAVARLGSAAPTFLAEHRGDDPLAIGSAFKLYVLGALVDDVAQGRRAWDHVVRLRPERRSLPSGVLQGWPEGAPATLHTLASLMISMSDNTATDHLLLELGRERVERMLLAMGNHAPHRSTPFLTTGELFRLKWGEPDLAPRYVKANEAERRALLASELVRVPLPGVSAIARTADEPRLIGELEWFASAKDLVRALDWLRKASDAPAGAPARGILAINPGIEAPGWKLVGFKGGSEPGVLELAWLLERPDGAWFSIVVGWNDPEGAVDQVKLLGIAQRALELAAKRGTVELR